MKTLAAGESTCRWNITFTALAFVLVLCSLTAHAKELINSGWGDVAIRGYDTVAYFTMDKAVKGSKEFATEYLGAKWYFANAEHRNLFVKDPLNYIPQYGGYCAVAEQEGGGHAMVNPTAWQIVDGKLYLFYNRISRDRWSSDDPAVARADAAWDRLKWGLE